MKSCLIIIPAYNEAGSIEKVVDHITDNHPEYDYLIINDGSTDETESICKRRQYHYVSLPINLGIGGAVQTGYQYALEYEYDIAVQIDGDGQHNVDYIREMVDLIESGEADAVIGSRFVNKEGFQSSIGRRIGIQFLSRLLQVLCFRRIKDVTSGFRAMDRRFIELFAGDYPSDYPEPETIMAIHMHGGVIREIPVVMNERMEGTSSINAVKSIYYMVKVTLAICIRRLSYGVRRDRKGVHQ